MGSSRKSKSGRAKRARSSERPPARKILPKTTNQALAEVSGIPDGVLKEIENQRGVLITVITLLHCLHVVLEHREGSVDAELDSRIEAATESASLPEMTALALERTHSVLFALDSNNLTNALRALKP